MRSPSSSQETVVVMRKRVSRRGRRLLARVAVRMPTRSMAGASAARCSQAREDAGFNQAGSRWPRRAAARTPARPA